MNVSMSEKGNAKNIASTGLLLPYISQLGDKYAPSNNKIRFENLQVVAERGKKAQSELNFLLPDYTNAVRERKEYFMPLSRFLTKLRKSYKAVEDITPQQLENFMTVVRRMKGLRKSKSSEKKIETGEEHSVSQMSFDQRTNNMEILVALLEDTKNFNPNETEFKVDSIKAMHSEMLQKTDAVAKAFAPLNASRTKRDKILYLGEDNLVDVFNAAKDYLFSILDSDSAEYKAISKIRFRRD